MNLTEKILAKASNQDKVYPGDIIQAKIDLAMTHDGTSPPTIKTFERISDKVWDREKIVIVFDHNLPANNIGSAEFQKITKKFARNQGITNIFTHGEGVCHQVLPEKGFLKPNIMVVGADSHTCTYGAFGAFATGVGATDMAIIFATGEIWLMVPETFKIVVNGILDQYVTPKDIILKIIGQIGAYGATYKALEFCGETVESMNVSGRMTICNMAVEMGAKNGIMEPNEATLDYLKKRSVKIVDILKSDKDSHYEKEFFFEVSDLEPQIASPHNVDNVFPISKVDGTSIDQAFIGSCTNGRLEDLRIAAEILYGRRIHQDVRLIVVPASVEIYSEALKEGIIDIFINAGAIVCNPGCGPCLGAHMGVLGSQEVCVSTSNRNFVGRMGDPTSEIYLANPAVVAYSSLSGEIRDPRK
jgi:methanogen homoaconitase large subunit